MKSGMKTNRSEKTVLIGKIWENASKGTRTPVLALRGPRPGPLDDGGGHSAGIVACAFWLVNQDVMTQIHEVHKKSVRTQECI